MNKKRILSLAGVVVTLAFIYLGMTVYGLLWAPNTKVQEPIATIFIATDASFEEVMEQLFPLLDDPLSFDRLSRIKRYGQNIRPGRYQITEGLNNIELINLLRSGNRPMMLTFNNQERIEDLAGALAKQIEQDSLSLYKAFTDPEFFQQMDGVDRDNVLALFIANSYEVYWNTSPEALCQRMIKEYRAFWNETRMAKATALGLSALEVISLAAIVQKESVKVSERPRIAGVYMNRLAKGIMLQADPTVIYAKKYVENDFSQVIRRVLYKDLTLDSPYNTYKYKGLPPGPIAMPDISSIEAVLSPEKHQFYYFVADPERPGYHQFSTNLKQHNQKRQAYVLWLAKNKIKR
jgi:UPF0755 protein